MNINNTTWFDQRPSHPPQADDVIAAERALRAAITNQNEYIDRVERTGRPDYEEAGELACLVIEAEQVLLAARDRALVESGLVHQSLPTIVSDITAAG